LVGIADLGDLGFVHAPGGTKFIDFGPDDGGVFGDN